MKVIKGSLTSILIKVTAFQKKYFSKTTPVGILNHLRQELDEIEEAVAQGAPKEHLKEEVADVYFMANQLMHTLDIDFDELTEAITKKLDKNLARNWPDEPDENGVYNHETSEDEGAS